jgi:choline dehydrogenase
MIYVRGHARDYDHWARRAPPAGAMPMCCPISADGSWHPGGHGGDPAWRGRGGPLHVTRGARTNPLVHAFVEAGRQAGYPLTDDYNGARQEGFGPFDMTVWQGERWSAAQAYLRPALKRPNCDLIRAEARRVVIEGGRATGVEIARGGRVETVRARAEVIVAASAINSPKLLMLSGIGPAAHLADHGIAVIADRARVSGRTCRTTWRSMSRWPAASRSRFTNTGTRWERPGSARAGC